MILLLAALTIAHQSPAQEPELERFVPGGSALEALPKHGSWHLEMKGDRLELLEPSRASDEDSELQGMERNGVVTGALRDQRGVPIGGALVSFVLEGAPRDREGSVWELLSGRRFGSRGRTVLTALDGTFAAKELWPGEHVVTVQVCEASMFGAVRGDEVRLGRVFVGDLPIHQDWILKRAGGPLAKRSVHGDEEVQPTSATGVVHVSVVTSRGVPFNGLARAWFVRLDADGEPVDEGLLERTLQRKSVFRRQLREGRYRVEVEHWRGRTWCGGNPIDVEWFLPVTQEVTVRVGEVTEVPLVLAPAGRVRVLVGGPVVEDPRCQDVWDALEADSAPSFGVVATRIDERSEPVSLDLLLPGCSSAARDRTLFGHRTTIYRPLLAGEYRFDFVAHGVSIHSCLVEVGDDRVTDVVLGQ